MVGGGGSLQDFSVSPSLIVEIIGTWLGHCDLGTKGYGPGLDNDPNFPICSYIFIFDVYLFVYPGFITLTQLYYVGPTMQCR